MFHKKKLQEQFRGQFPIPSASVRKNHSSSLTLIRITLQWDVPVRLYTIPSIVRVNSSNSSYFSRRYFEWIAYTTTTTFCDTRHSMLTRQITWLKNAGKMNNTGNPATHSLKDLLCIAFVVVVVAEFIRLKCRVDDYYCTRLGAHIIYKILDLYTFLKPGKLVYQPSKPLFATLTFFLQQSLTLHAKKALYWFSIANSFHY